MIYIINTHSTYVDMGLNLGYLQDHWLDLSMGGDLGGTVPKI